MNDIILLQDNTLLHPVDIPLVGIFVKKLLVLKSILTLLGIH